jgi:hypothetical protein
MGKEGGVVDSFRRLLRVTEVRHLRPSRDHVAGDLEIQILFLSVIA